jgi:hypothetical protein
LPQAAWGLFGSGMMYVQPACFSSIALWIVDLSQEKAPDRNCGGVEFVALAADVYETVPSISTIRANKCLMECIAL